MPIKPKASIRKNTTKTQQDFVTVGPYSSLDEKGSLVFDESLYKAARMERAAKIASSPMMEGWNTYGADIDMSDNPGFFNFEFPIDSLEMPQSRSQELRYYRLAYDRDPIVARAIDLHTEIPMSKISLDRPQCSSNEFADYVLDYYYGFVGRVDLFQLLLQGVHQYWAMGEAFFFVEEDEKIELCPVAKKEFGKEGVKPDVGSSPFSQSDFNPPAGLEEKGFLGRNTSSKRVMSAPLIPFTLLNSPTTQKIAASLRLNASDVVWTTDELLAKVEKGIEKLAKRIKTKTAAPIYRTNPNKVSDPPTGDAGAGAPDAPPPGEGASIPEGGDLGGEDIGGGPGEDFGGSVGGGNPFAGTPLGDDVDEALEGEEQPSTSGDPELDKLRKYYKLLMEQKDLLEDLKAQKENKVKDQELFSHVFNPTYSGPANIRLLPPETIEIEIDPLQGPVICYKPTEAQKEGFLDKNSKLSKESKEFLEQTGKLQLNTDPNKGSYVVHFARKKAPFEPHGRSILQRCIRTIMYREKLRQAQTQIASRNMTPKTFISAPNAPVTTLMELRAMVDQAKSDPDATVIVNYEATWNEIGAEGRLLALDSEWGHCNQELAAGLGFTPEFLTGEGQYANSRIQLEILNNNYVLFRSLLSQVVEELIFRPIAAKKGFYEIDKYGRPRWIYPKVQFSKMALRDSGDIYEMLFNLYSKGSIPVSTILEHLNIDPDTCRKQLEEDLFTVNDSRFNDFLTNFYSNLANDDRLSKHSDVIDRMLKSLGLKEKNQEIESGVEGTGEGM